MSTRPLDFIKLNLQLDTKQFLLHRRLPARRRCRLPARRSRARTQGAQATTLLSGLTSTLTPPILEPSMLPMYVLLDLRPLPEILPLHLLGRPMPRGLSKSSTSMMVLLLTQIHN